MSRKAFLIWGLVIIQFALLIPAVFMYLSLAKVIDPKTIGATARNLTMLTALVGFGTILHLRFKTTGRRKRVLALCLPFFIASMFLGGFLAAGYMMSDVFSAAHERYFNAIHEWAKLEDPKPAISWSALQRLNYVLFSLPTTYLTYWGLFVLLWFGSLDPRTPSKNRLTQFMKTGFQRNDAPVVTVEFTKLTAG